MIKKVHIRDLIREDYESITDLTNQFGLNITSDTVCYQIDKILRNPDHFVFVAVLGKKMVGYIHCFKTIRLTSRPFIEICGLIVDEKERRIGIGKLLVQKVENINNGYEKIRVRCNTKRELAHSFYNNLHYSLYKEQKIFEKKLHTIIG